MVSTGEPTPAAKRALRSIPARASSSRRSTRTWAPLGQATGASAVTAPGAAARKLAMARSIAASSATWAGMSGTSSPCHGPPSRRSASCSGSGAALSSRMGAEPGDIVGDGRVKRPGGEI